MKHVPAILGPPSSYSRFTEEDTKRANAILSKMDKHFAETGQAFRISGPEEPHVLSAVAEVAHDLGWRVVSHIPAGFVEIRHPGSDTSETTLMANTTLQPPSSYEKFTKADLEEIESVLKEVHNHFTVSSDEFTKSMGAGRAKLDVIAKRAADLGWHVTVHDHIMWIAHPDEEPRE